MKTLVIILGLLTFSLTHGLSQQRLTDLKGTGSAIQNLLQTYKGTHYLIQILQDETVEVYKITDTESKVFLHSISLKNILNHNVMIGNRIFYRAENYVYEYDFLKNKNTKILEVPEIYNSIKLINVDNKTLLIRNINYPEYQGNYYYDLLNPPKPIPNYYYQYRSSDYLVHFGYNEELDEFKIFNYNLDKETLDSIPISCDLFYSWYRHENSLYFLDCDGALKEFVLDRNEIIDYPNIKISSYGLPTVYVDQTIILLANNSEDQVTIYDRNSQKVITRYRGNNLYGINEILKGSVKHFIRHDSTMLLFSTYSVTILELFGDKVSLHPFFGLWNAENLKLLDNKILLLSKNINDKLNFELVDIETRKSQVLSYSGEVLSSWQIAGAVHFGDDIILNLSPSQIYSNLMTLNFKKLEINFNRSLDGSTSGFFDSSRLLEINNKICINNKRDLYVVEDDKIVKLNPGELGHNALAVPRLIDDAIYFIVDSTQIIYKYDGVEVTKEYDPKEFADIRLVENIGDYSFVGDYIVLVSSFSLGDLLILNRKTKEYWRKPKSNRLNYHYGLKKIGDYVYFDNHNGLSRTNGPDIEVIRPQKDIDAYLYSINGRVLEIDNDGIWEIDKDGNYYELYTNENTENGKASVIINSTNEAALVYLDSTYFHYDGHLEVIEDNSRKLKIIDYSFISKNLIFISELLADGKSRKRIYNMQSKTFEEIDFDKANERLVSLIRIKNNEFLISNYSIGASNYFRFYASSNDRQNLELLETYLLPIGFYDLDYNSISNKGMVLTSNLIVEFDLINNISLLENAIGCSALSNVIIRNNAFYFFACDNEKGRQLYRYNVNMNHGKLANRNQDSTFLFPNPADNHISVMNMETGETKFRIYSMDGKLLKSGINAQLIPIESLSPGTYHLEIINNGQIQNQLFVKQ